MKVITICGSLKFRNEIMAVAAKLTLKGNVVLTPFIINKSLLTKDEKIMLGNVHKEKIKLADKILIMNVNNYIGDNTKNEIEFAKKLNKEIIYYTNIRGCL